MATKMKRLSLHLRTFLLMISMCAPGDGYSCPYGQNCLFEPAANGQTPPCAQPGLTFCTDVDTYPEQLIRRLVENGQYDIRSLLMDESREDFNAKKGHYPYGPNSIPNVDQISLVNDDSYVNTYHTKYNHGIFSQKTPLQPPSPVDPSPYNVNTFQSTNYTKFDYNSYNTPSYWNNPTKALRPDVANTNFGINTNIYNPNMVPSYDSNLWFRQGSSGVTQYNPNEWWKFISPSRSNTVTVQRSVSFQPNIRKKRNAELVRAARQRKLTGAEALRIALGFASEDISAERPRRQALNTEELCPTNSRYTTPRAALNTKGKWMYVVNMPENMTQLVKVEICRSANAECNGLCSVPLGYSSRCEQKFIQKRLVALRPEGNNLATDVFWIPSCCQCTIINNNNN